MNQEDFFSIEEFKKWMQVQNKESAPRFVRPKAKEDVIGLTVESKLSALKLTEKIQPIEGNTHVLAKDFRHNSGIIREAVGHTFLIEVNSGKFYIPRCFVRKA